MFSAPIPRLVVLASALVMSVAACSNDDNAANGSSPASSSESSSSDTATSATATSEAPTTAADTTADGTSDTTADDTAPTTTDSSSDTTATTAAPTPPAGLASQVLAPAEVTYVSESPIDTSGYWTSYAISEDSDLSLDDYGSVLETLGWTIDDMSDNAITATMSGAWLDVLVVDADQGDTVSVCVWNAAPADDACGEFPATLSESYVPPTTDGS